MMIKRRLALSNLLMIALPVLFTCVITAVCLGALFLTLVLNDSAIMTDRQSFEDTTEMVAESLEQSMHTEDTDAAALFEDIGTQLTRQGLVLRVTDAEDALLYTAGDFTEADASLFQTAMALEGKGLIEVGGRVVSREPMTVGEHLYYCYVFGSDGPPVGDKEEYWEQLTLMVVGVMALAVVVSVLLTNRFLTHFVFRRIEEPLDILACGVQEIAGGNLDYRIRYDINDEFAPICAQFNEMAARLKQSVDEIQRHEESRKELMASISHDLRSPLTAIQAYVEGLLDGVANTPEKQARYLRTIKAKAEALAHMVSQIFLYSKMELEEFPLHPEPLRLDEEWRALSEVIVPEYAAKGLTITSDAAPSACIIADGELLRRVLMNIVDNSLKYKTAAMGHLHLSFAEDERHVAMTLTDDGPGVPDEALGQLFDVFYRSDPARHNPAQGSGLGLAIVARAVDRMNGTLRAANAIPHGLAITITLPKGDATDERTEKNIDC